MEHRQLAGEACEREARLEAVQTNDDDAAQGAWLVGVSRGNNLTIVLSLLVTLLVAAPPAQALTASAALPKTPADLPQCTKALDAKGPLPQTAGETIRYLVDVNGLSVGTIDFKIERVGTYAGQLVTEYRSLFKLDSLVASFVPAEGRAASLVDLGSHLPLTSTNRYKSDKNNFEEDVTYASGGKGLSSKRLRNNEKKVDERSFPSPAIDFVSAYYVMRSFPAETNGCALLYANQRAYTVWVKHIGQESVRTPVGSKPADKYELRYASEKQRTAITATIWMATDATRLPYKMRVEGKQPLEARVHMYEVPPAK